MVDPVVVTPDMDSKKASVTLSCSSLNMKGREPKTAMTSHDSAVMTKAWRTSRRFQLRRVDRVSETPTNSVTAKAVTKTCQSEWPSTASTAAGTSIAHAKIDSRMPTMKKAGRRSISSGGQAAYSDKRRPGFARRNETAA